MSLATYKVVDELLAKFREVRDALGLQSAEPHSGRSLNGSGKIPTHNLVGGRLEIYVCYIGF